MSGPNPKQIDLDQAAIMRHAMKAGLRSVPVFSRAFGVGLVQVEEAMAGIWPEPVSSPEPDAGEAPEVLGLNLKVGASSGEIETIRRQMATLATRLGVTIHSEFNGQGWLACPGEEIARVYMRNVAAVTQEAPAETEWETVFSTNSERLERFPAEGGWIYRSTQWTEHDYESPGPCERSESSVFVAGPR